MAGVPREIRGRATAIVEKSLAVGKPIIRDEPPRFRLLSSLALGAYSRVAELAVAWIFPVVEGEIT